MTELAITKYLDGILSMIESNLVTQVTAPTGSGKSIYVIKALAENGKRVFSSVPTRISATSLCSYLKTLNPEILIGHAAEGNVCYDRETQVVYATSGHVRRKMLSFFKGGVSKRKGLTFTDVLVLDETHSGSMDNTVIISLWMEAKNRGAKVPKLLLLSATPTDLPVIPVPVFCTVPVETPFPVKIIYDPPDHEDKLYEHAADIVIHEHKNSTITGDFLVFVPGSRECDNLVDMLKEHIPEDEALILPAYSSLQSEDLKLLYTPTGHVRKIIISTNIAESSITIEGLGLVIDTLLCKEASSSSSGSTRLQESLITKDSAKQRSGRTGRTCPGVCYRLMSENQYDLLEDHRTPEIYRMPIHNVVMEFLQANVDPVKTICGVDPEKVSESIELLNEIGMLELDNDEYKVTSCGNFSPLVPIGVKNSAFLWKWVQSGYPLYPGVVIACIIDVHTSGYFYIPRRKRNQTKSQYTDFCESHIKHFFGKWIGETTLHTYLNMWCAFVKSTRRSHFRLITDPFSYNYFRWSRDNSINYKQLSELVLVVSQTYRCAKSHFRRCNTDVSLFDVDLHLEKAIPILQSVNVRDTIIKTFGGAIMHHNRTFVKYIYCNNRIISRMEWAGQANPIALASHEIMSSMGLPIGFIDIAIPSPDPQTSESESESESETSGSF